MNSRLLLVLLALTVAIAVAASAGTTGKIAGEVIDATTREALVGVSVQIEGTALGAATNLDGYFVILNVPPGTYSLTLSAVGYRKKRIADVKVSIDLTTTVNTDLVSTIVEVGEEVVVTAQRQAVKKDLTSSESRVDALAIAAMPVTNVAEVLQLQAGITVGKGGDIHIRGGRTSEVAYWVDGVSISDAYDGNQAVQVENNAVQELQVISGTFNAEYGSAMSGIVNIVTKDGDQRYRGSLTAYAGDYVTSNGWLADNRTFTLSDPMTFPGTGEGEIYYGLNKVRPLDNHAVEASLSGPVPGLADLTFYVSGRYFASDGYLYGNWIFNPDGSTVANFTPDRLEVDEQGNVVAVRIPDNPYTMNRRKRLSGQAKLTYQFSGAAKLALSGIGSTVDFRDYNHDWFLNPDADVNKFDRGYTFSALWTHSLGASSFYTANLSYFFKGFKEYLYEDPFDTRYNVDPNATSRDVYEWISAGSNLHRFKRNTETVVAKLDYTDQISQRHQLKAGVELKLHRLYLEDFNLIQDPTTLQPAIPEPTSPLYEQYTRRPREFSVYVQDKLEYERMIVNIGIRFDYFNARSEYPADPQDPNIYLPQKPENQGKTLAERQAYWYKKASAKRSISPRFGISYPITDQGVLHFSYGHFLQIPSFINLYQKPEYKVSTASGIQGIYGNPDLEPQKTIMYELGLQQSLSDVFSFDVTGFYRDTRNWVTTSPSIPVRDPDTYTSAYQEYVNRDYSNSRGVTLTVTKRQSDLWTLNLAYTFQVAEGNNSNPDDEQAAARDNKEPARALTPLDWDQMHTVNLSLGLGENDWGAFAIGRYGTGLPYTPVINQAEARGEDAARAVQKNSRRRPDNLTLDLRLFKNFTLSPFTLSLFVRVFNLFDQRNEVDVYGETGRAFATPEALGAANVNRAGRVNPVEAFLVRPEYYSEPREIQVGFELNF